MVAHDDDGGGVPLVLLLEEGADVGEVGVGEGEVVEVGGMVGGEGGGVAVVDSAGMGDGQVQEEEGEGGVGELGIGGGEDIVVLGDVAEDFAGVHGVVAGGEGAWIEDGLEDSVDGCGEVVGEGVVVGDVDEGAGVGSPEALVEYLGEDAAVGVVKAGDAGAVAGVECILPDGLVLLEGGPGVGEGIVEEERVSVGGGADGVGGEAGEESWDDAFGEDVVGADVGEGGGLLSELIEGGEEEVGCAMLVDLAIGEFVEEEPNDTRFGGGAGCQGGLVQGLGGVECTSLPVEPKELEHDDDTDGGDEAKDGGDEVLGPLEGVLPVGLPEEEQQEGRGEWEEEEKKFEGVRSGFVVRESIEAFPHEGGEEGESNDPDDALEGWPGLYIVEEGEEQQPKAEQVKEDRQEECGCRAADVVDEGVCGGDEWGCEEEKRQSGEAESHGGEVGEELHVLVGFLRK